MTIQQCTLPCGEYNICNSYAACMCRIYIMCSNVFVVLGVFFMHHYSKAIGSSIRSCRVILSATTAIELKTNVVGRGVDARLYP